MQRAVSYLRVSGKTEVKGDRFLRQREAIARYARRHDIDVIAEFHDEGDGGCDEWANREGLAALFERVDSKDIKLVLVERADRLARDLIVSETILAKCISRHISVIEVESGQDLTAAAEPTRILIRQILGALTHFDKTCVLQKLKLARDRKRRETGHCEGPKPYGSKPEELPVVKKIGVLRARGATLQAIADKLTAEKAPTRSGARWSKQHVRNVLDRLRNEPKRRNGSR